MFKLLGALLAVYTAYAAYAGSVYANSGPGGRLVFREESPSYFWVVIAIYSGLSVALLTVF